MKLSVLFFILSISILLISCGGAPVNTLSDIQNSSSNSDSYLNNEMINGPGVYAYLHKANDAWVLSDFSKHSKNPNADGVWVALNNLKPQAATTLSMTVKCQLDCADLRNTNTKYDTTEELINALIIPQTGPFYDESLNVGKTALVNTFGVLMTFGLAAGIRSYQYEFDHDAYNSALNQALKKSNMSHKWRSDLIYNLKNFSDLAKNELNKLESEREEIIRKGKYSSDEIEYKYDVKDTSGLYSGSANTLGVNVSYYEKNSYSKPNKINMRSYERQFLASKGTNKESILTSIKEEFETVRGSLIGGWKRPQEYSFKCTSGYDYKVTIKCPSNISFNGKKRTINVPITVVAKRVRLFYPKLKKSNKTISADINRNGLMIVNKGNKYIQVDSISLYWGGKISTQKNVNIELAPNAKLQDRYSLNNFNLNDLSAAQPFRLDSATKQALNKLNISTGFAIKYTDNSGQFNTLFVSKDFKAIQLINS